MRIAITGASGYIGSVLRNHLSQIPGIAIFPVLRDTDYRTLSPRDWAEFDVVIHLAAHSSVAACQNAPADAWHNNVTGFEAMLRSLGEGTILIYASSGSVYHNCPGEASESTVRFESQTLYDLTKFTMDGLSRFCGCRWYALRFGTVCGFSPRMRSELMINAMALAAGRGTVRIQNGTARRAILGMQDCVRAIQAVIECVPPAGIYNLCSFNSTIGEIGSRVAASCGAKIEYGADTSCYDFYLSNQRFRDATAFEFRETVETIVDSIFRGKVHESVVTA